MQDMKEAYEQYLNDVFKYLCSLTQDADMAEELAQETFYIALKEIHKFRGEAKLKTWLCTIAKNLWIAECKKKKKFVSIDENMEDSEETLEERIIEKEEKRSVYESLEKLEEKVRQVVRLRIISELSFREIGDMLGETENWARVTFYRAKQKIKEEQKDERK